MSTKLDTALHRLSAAVRAAQDPRLPDMRRSARMRRRTAVLDAIRAVRAAVDAALPVERKAPKASRRPRGLMSLEKTDEALRLRGYERREINLHPTVGTFASAGVRVIYKNVPGSNSPFAYVPIWSRHVNTVTRLRALYRDRTARRAYLAELALRVAP